MFIFKMSLIHTSLIMYCLNYLQICQSFTFQTVKYQIEFLHHLKAFYVSGFSRIAQLKYLTVKIEEQKEKENAVDKHCILRRYTVLYSINRVEHIKDNLYKNLAKIYHHGKRHWDWAHGYMKLKRFHRENLETTAS